MSYIISAEKFYESRMPGAGDLLVFRWASGQTLDFDQPLCTWSMSLSRSSECSLTTHILIIHIDPSLRRQSCFSLLLPVNLPLNPFTCPLPQGSRLWKIACEVGALRRISAECSQGGSVVMLKKAASPQGMPWAIFA